MLKLVHASNIGVGSVIDYYNSYKIKSELNSCTVSTIIEDKNTYLDRVMFSFECLYYLIDDYNSDYIIGHASIEDSCLIDYHLKEHNHGHVAYAIRPLERKKGYGSLLLNLIIEKCIESGMKEICVSCYEDNIGSRKIIEKNGGIFDGKWVSELDKKIALKYFINLNSKVKVDFLKCRINKTIY